MAEIFPRWTNDAPRYLAAGGLAFMLSGVAGVWYFFSPSYTDVGYQPRQPVAFSHKLHVGELHIDCRYCHAAVEISPVASVPPTETCMNCHRLVTRDSDKLAAVRDSAETGEPIRWTRVHDLPDYVYFDHSVHVAGGIGCSSCHGNVADMDELRQVEPLSMGWCLGCHRNPEPFVRALEQITDTAWEPETPGPRGRTRTGRAANPPTDCSACHR